MDDVNINEICFRMEEEEIDEEKWIKFNWIDKQNDDNESYSLENENSNVQDNVDEDSNFETAQASSSESKVSCINTEPEDISDGISVITDTDTDVNTNTQQIYQFNDNIYKPLRILEIQINKQANKNVFLALLIGITIGFIVSYSFVTLEADSKSNEINTESLKTVKDNIINTCKALTEVKSTLNEIKTHTTVDKKIMKHFVEQLFKVDSANITNDKPSITAESFNFDSHSLDQVSQLQVSLYILSSLAFIHDKNSSLENEINEILDIVNSTKAFYENLILFNNNTQNDYNALALKILQHDSSKIHITSKLFVSNMIKKMNKLTLSVYNKYAKQRHKLIKKLCDLKSILPDDELLKQLTENNQLFKNYDKSCSSIYLSKKLNTKTFEKRNTKVNKNRSEKEADDTVHTKYDKEKSQKIDDEKNSLNNENTKNAHNYTTTKSQNASDKIHNTSQLPPDLKENTDRKMLKHICTKYNELRHNAWLKNKHHKDSKFVEQSTEDSQENNKESVNWCTKESDYLQSIKIQIDMSKDNLDSILIQLLEDVCPISTNSCPRFNNVNDVPVMPATSSCKTKNCIVNFNNNKHDTNSKKSMWEFDISALKKGSSEENRPKQKDYFKSSDSIKKTLNNNDKNIKENKKKLSQYEIENYMSDDFNDYHRIKRSSFNNRVTKQNNQDYINMDWQNEIDKRFYLRNKQRPPRRRSNWYFRRVFSRRIARKYAEKLYAQNSQVPKLDNENIWTYKKENSKVPKSDNKKWTYKKENKKVPKFDNDNIWTYKKENSEVPDFDNDDIWTYKKENSKVPKSDNENIWTYKKKNSEVPEFDNDEFDNDDIWI